jgi:hypothetical protein
MYLDTGIPCGRSARAAELGEVVEMGVKKMIGARLTEALLRA